MQYYRRARRKEFDLPIANAAVMAVVTNDGTAKNIRAAVSVVFNIKKVSLTRGKILQSKQLIAKSLNNMPILSNHTKIGFLFGFTFEANLSEHLHF